MKGRSSLICVLTLLIMLCGCTSGEKGREPEDTVLAEVLGVDYAAGRYVLTAAGKDGTGGTVMQTAEGTTVAEAFAAMPGAGERWVSLTNVTHLLLGDGVEPGTVLTYILEDSGMSWRTTVWYAPLAAGLMAQTEDGGTARLTVLQQAGAETVTVLDALAELAGEGAVSLPGLTVRGGQPEITGMLRYERSGEEERT